MSKTVRNSEHLDSNDSQNDALKLYSITTKKRQNKQKKQNVSLPSISPYLIPDKINSVRR